MFFKSRGLIISKMEDWRNVFISAPSQKSTTNYTKGILFKAYSHTVQEKREREGK